MLIVEDGTGLTTANAYVTVAEADAYFAADASWADVEDSLKETYIMQATQAVDLLFGERYMSYPSKYDQALLFPRVGFYNTQKQYIASNEVPKRLKNAVCEVAKVAQLGGNILPDRSLASTLISRSEELDGLKRSYTFAKDASPSNETLQGFYKVELMLAPLLMEQGGYLPAMVNL